MTVEGVGAERLWRLYGKLRRRCRIDGVQLDQDGTLWIIREPIIVRLELWREREMAVTLWVCEPDADWFQRKRRMARALVSKRPILLPLSEMGPLRMTEEVLSRMPGVYLVPTFEDGGLPYSHPAWAVFGWLVNWLEREIAQHDEDKDIARSAEIAMQFLKAQNVSPDKEISAREAEEVSGDA